MAPLSRKKRIENILSVIYLDEKNPVAYTGSYRNLLKEGQKILPDLKLREVKDYLNGLEVYSQFRLLRKRWRRRKYIPLQPLKVICFSSVLGEWR